MNAWAFGTLVLITLIVVAGILLDRIADRGHEIRWHERFYQPQRLGQYGRVIDVVSHPAPTTRRDHEKDCGGRRRSGSESRRISGLG